MLDDKGTTTNKPGRRGFWRRFGRGLGKFAKQAALASLRVVVTRKLEERDKKR